MSSWKKRREKYTRNIFQSSHTFPPPAPEQPPFSPPYHFPHPKAIHICIYIHVRSTAPALKQRSGHGRAASRGLHTGDSFYQKDRKCPKSARHRVDAMSYTDVNLLLSHQVLSAEEAKGKGRGEGVAAVAGEGDALLREEEASLLAHRDAMQHLSLTAKNDYSDDEDVDTTMICPEGEASAGRTGDLWPQVLAAVSVSLGSMIIGFSSAYTSPALASMAEEGSTLIVTEQEESWIGGLLPLSALVGGIIGGPLIESLGRRNTIMGTAVPFIIAWLLIAMASNVGMVLGGRALGGFCVGIGSLSLPVYLGETIQPEVRGMLGLLPTAIGNIGILVCFVVGTYLNWSNLAFFGATLPVPFFICMFLIPETPRWYISKNKTKEARKALQWLRGKDTDVSAELQELENSNAENKKCPVEPEDGVTPHSRCSSVSVSSLSNLFSPSNARPLIISVGLMFFQQMSGINAVIFYTVTIFKEAGTSLDENLCTIVVGLVNFMSTFIATALIDRLGRKVLLNVSGVSMIISLLALGSFFYVKEMEESYLKTAEMALLANFSESLENATMPTFSTNLTDSVMLNGSFAEVNETLFSDSSLPSSLASWSWLPLTAFVVYVVGFSIGYGPIPWLMMGEVLPAKIRGSAASIATAFNWSCTFIVTKTFRDLLSLLGAAAVFWLFGGFVVVGLVFVFFLVPETQGRSLEEIEMILTGRKKDIQPPPGFDKRGPVRRMSSIANLKPLPMGV